MPSARHTLTATAMVGLTLAACSTPAGHDTTPGQEPTVTTKLLDFTPDKLTVKAGTTVVWQVTDGIGHTVTTGTYTLGGDGLRSAEEPDGVMDLPLAKGKNVSRTFDKPGTYTYYCSIHKGMNGEITVTP